MKAQAALLTIALAACLAAPVRAGQAWSFHDEVYHVYASSLNLEEMKSAGITLVSHIPVTKDYFARAHGLGIRVLPYVSLYKVVNLAEWPEGKTHPFWRELDVSSRPGWVLVGPDGQRRRPFDNPDYRRGAFQSCCNAPGIDDAYVRGVKALMEMGADGVFVVGWLGGWVVGSPCRPPCPPEHRGAGTPREACSAHRRTPHGNAVRYPFRRGEPEVRRGGP